MFGIFARKRGQRKAVRDGKGSPLKVSSGVRANLFSCRTLAWAFFLFAVTAIALVKESGVKYVVGQRVEHPIYAKVDFNVPDPLRTKSDREAARAKTPSYYKLNDSALTYDRIRADLMRLYQMAVEAESFEAFTKALGEAGWPADKKAYDRLRALINLPNDEGRTRYQGWINKLPLEEQHIVRNLSGEARDPQSLADFIVLVTTKEGRAHLTKKSHAELIPQGNRRALQGIASFLARRLPAFELRPTIEAVVLATFSEQPTIIFDQERTQSAMQEAADKTPEAMTAFEAGSAFITPGIIGTKEYQLLTAHHNAQLALMNQGTAQGIELRREWLLHRVGMVVLALTLAIGLLVYTGVYEPSIYGDRLRTIAFFVLVPAVLLTVAVIDTRLPDYPELVLVPCLTMVLTLGIVFRRRFALGATCITSLLAAVLAGESLTLLLVVLTGVAAAAYQLDDVRSRTKLIRVGTITALLVFITTAAGNLLDNQMLAHVLERSVFAAVAALISAFVVSGALPFIEAAFNSATSLALLEWRDPTKPLLQLLAREAPGTYNHSLVIGTMAEAACERIGANGLLAQVGALYHDIGKIYRPAYFAENQEGNISRHENLAPTMRLLIILGHVKDGLDLAKQYKLPKVLRRFIAEHHGTTVVRYFHQMATDKQIASGKHDREVAEADFRYGGPKPRSKESAVLMLCDGIEGAVRALSDPSVGRIESVVQQVVSDRLNDGQFDECDITLREIRVVEDSLVKTLCSVYHGRVAYPKAQQKETEHQQQSARLSG